MTLTEVETKYGAEEAEFVRAAVQAVRDAEEYDCEDNHRLALQGDAESEEEYEEAQRSGCCGFVDITVGSTPGGRTFLYGFNHGH